MFQTEIVRNAEDKHRFDVDRIGSARLASMLKSHWTFDAPGHETWTLAYFHMKVTDPRGNVVLETEDMRKISYQGRNFELAGSKVGEPFRLVEGERELVQYERMAWTAIGKRTLTVTVYDEEFVRDEPQLALYGGFLGSVQASIVVTGGLNP